MSVPCQMCGVGRNQYLRPGEKFIKKDPAKGEKIWLGLGSITRRLEVLRSVIDFVLVHDMRKGGYDDLQVIC